MKQFCEGQRVIINNHLYLDRPATIGCKSLAEPGCWLVYLEPDGDPEFVADADVQPAPVNEPAKVGK